MFKKLIIKNFQKWKKLVIRFDPHVTIIIGRNDVGKSAIIRAIRWLSLNSTRGNNFLRKGSKRVSVILRLDKNQISRSTVPNEYKRGNASYKAIGTNVPESIRKILRIAEINFQQQRDSDFWFNLTPGKVAKELNKLVDLEAIDFLHTEVTKRIRSTTAELTVCEKRLVQAEESAEQLTWCRRLNVKMGKLYRAFCRTRLESHRIDQNRSVLSVAVCTDTIRQTAAIGAANCAQLARLARQTGQTGENTRQLRRAVAGIKTSERMTKLRLPKLPKQLQEIETESLLGLIEGIKHEQETICQCQRRIRTKKKRLGNHCPVCGQRLSRKQLKLRK